MNIAERVKTQRIHLGLTQTELANKVGISQQSLQKIEDARTSNPRKLLALAKALECTPEWLQFGIEGVSSGEAESNVEAAPFKAPSKKLPVVSHVQAGAWSEAIDYRSLADDIEWEESPFSASDNAFWLKVVGDSMTSPVGTSIPEGHLILVDPDIPADNGSLVVAKLDGTDEVTFKKLYIDAGQKYLKPLNPNYRPFEINGNCRIVGVVKEAKVKL
ncbi:helix-turn-helix domain-containing protein [Marinomonas mediterranea]|jgi:phage repressor protein. Serine peptidase. MEROPS family S24|uniref:Phage repressor like transcriptional regulator, XRE family n=1 Tax=Marinomonas mediterranea (strain ATCC 700492 / JCM 21426 / NBRC 103028 / MMB-1) TaxID=717774 RepID=F2K1E0_MARM1|nr:LexA family transcriptional regulator [Marinomonas mediterranea]ADZ91071.1 phage repressor like transcriptional regulator, XRE family [Marinomonas mediterranea MMB-1]WCN13135.1 helix-turn-helix domain-containing protein [Marinomonas mediterranea]WCN17206.1 helix-turn-helix domain-containing protein [Marinomonas mediterranea MMB-1]